MAEGHQPAVETGDFSGAGGDAGQVVGAEDDGGAAGFNRGAEQLFGYGRNEVLGKPLDLLLPPHLLAVHREHVRGFGRGAETARHMGERREIHGRGQRVGHAGAPRRGARGAAGSLLHVSVLGS